MNISNEVKYTLAKTFTELAIQNDLIKAYDNAADTANEVTTFFNSIIENIGSTTKNN
jgi:hypothetical protein